MKLHEYQGKALFRAAGLPVPNGQVADNPDEVERKKRVYYLSIEYLIGRLLFDTLTNLGLFEPIREALAGFEIDLEHLRVLESDAGLGTGGLGRSSSRRAPPSICRST